jgi:hypothetical protein
MPWEEVTDPSEIAIAEGMLGDAGPTREDLLRKQALGLPRLFSSPSSRQAVDVYAVCRPTAGSDACVRNGAGPARSG